MVFRELIRKFERKLVRIFYPLLKNQRKNDLHFQKELESLCTSTKLVMREMRDVRTFDNKFELLDFCIQESGEGHILEFGVYKAQTLNYMAKNYPDRRFFGYDTFEGLPETWRTGFFKGHFDVEELPNTPSNVSLVKGLFSETLPEQKQELGEVALIHIDCDLYSSTKAVFNEIGNIADSGTIIVFDEYFNYPGWEDGEYKAFQEFIEDKDLDFQYLGYVDTGEQVAVTLE